ncbi:MAG: AMP-binding protein, partial [Actinomycetota bacterium]
MSDDPFASLPTVAGLLEARVGDDHDAYVHDEDRWTWDEVVAETSIRAALLDEHLDRSRPPHVGVLLDNVPEYLFLIGGAALAGAAVVGVNPTRRGAELTTDIAQADCQLVITTTAHRELLDDDLGVPVLLVDGDDYRRSLADHAGAGLPATSPHPTETLLLLFTSGSTSAPKAVVCSTARAAITAERAAEAYEVTRDDIAYCSMPLFHGNAVFACWLPILWAGGTIVLRDRFSASRFAADINRHRCTYFTYVGRSIAYVLARPPTPEEADNDLRMGFGTEASAQDRELFLERFGCPLVEGYGSSEGAISIIRGPDTPPAALGRPREGEQVVVLDPDTGAACPPARFDDAGRLVNGDEAIGELVNPDVGLAFEGYYANDEATAERLRDGQYWSGDLGYVDEDGHVYFAGRNADWLRVDSENFAAAPVERILHRFEPVVMAAVYGVPDARTGDQVM